LDQDLKDKFTLKFLNTYPMGLTFSPINRPSGSRENHDPDTKEEMK